MQLNKPKPKTRCARPGPVLFGTHPPRGSLVREFGRNAANHGQIRLHLVPSTIVHEPPPLRAYPTHMRTCVTTVSRRTTKPTLPTNKLHQAPQDTNQLHHTTHLHHHAHRTTCRPHHTTHPTPHPSRTSQTNSSMTHKQTNKSLPQKALTTPTGQTHGQAAKTTKHHTAAAEYKPAAENMPT